MSTAQDPNSAIANMYQPSAPVAPAAPIVAPPSGGQQQQQSAPAQSNGGGSNNSSKGNDAQNFGASMSKEDAYGYGDDAFKAALAGKKKEGGDNDTGVAETSDESAEGGETQGNEAKTGEDAAAQTAPTEEELEAQLNRSNLPKKQKENWKQMRAAQQALEKANQELLQKNKEYEERLGKAGPVPDDLKKEVEAVNRKYQEAAAKLREYDIISDPEFQRDYVTPVAQNNKQIGEILSKIGRNNGHSEDAIRQYIADYEAKGYTLNNLKDELKSIEESGDLDTAQTIRLIIDKNKTIEINKQHRIDTWKEEYTARTAEREQRQRAEQEEAIRIGNEASKSTFEANLRDLADKFPLLKEPPKPLSTDAPAVRQAKQAAWDEWNKAMDVQADLDALNNELGLPDAKKVAAARGRIFALAKQGLALQRVLANQFPKSDAATKKELAELKAQLAKLNKTGDLSRAHTSDMGAAAAQQQPLKPTGNTEADFERALRQAMPGVRG